MEASCELAFLQSPKTLELAPAPALQQAGDRFETRSVLPDIMSPLYQPRPVLSSQRYSPGSEYVDTRRGSYHSAQPHSGRLPLRESNGNVQAHAYNGVVSCYQQQPAIISPPLQPNFPVVPSQSFDCLYRMSEPRQQSRQTRRNKHGPNPLYFWPAFSQYRNRQASKDNQKDKGGVWRRDELEDAFVDG